MRLDPPAQSSIKVAAKITSVFCLHTRYSLTMTSVVAITVSFPREQVEYALEIVSSGEAPSLSAYVSTAPTGLPLESVCEEEDSLADLVADMIAENGVPGVEAYAWADEVLGLRASAR